jgi:endonuclease-8
VPEGDNVWRTARMLHAALAGRELTRSDIRVPRFATADLAGQVVENVVSRGKHLLIRAGGWTIHSHLMMDGIWHVYPQGARWRRPAFTARCVLETTESVAVGFDLGLLQVIPTAGESEAIGHLGPDLLGPDWDAERALRRVAADPDRPVGLALLDQRNLAGIGNIYRCELCFLAGVHPRTAVRGVPDLRRLVELAWKVLNANRERGRRVTTGNRRGEALWVYGRAGRPCLRCGTAIAQEDLGDNDLELRRVYFCPHCQPLHDSRGPAQTPTRGT